MNETLTFSGSVIWLIGALLFGAGAGYLIGYLYSMGKTRAQIAGLLATNESARESIARLEATLNARIEEEKSTLNLASAVKNVESKMAELARQTQEAELKRVEGETSIKTQIEGMKVGNESLLRETTKLAGALSNSQSRGKYGETQLEMLLENAGLVENVHFFRQDFQSNENGIAKPDIRIAVPGGSEIFIDSKFPFHKFLDAMGESDPSARQELMKAHAKDLLGHVSALAKRGYQDKNQSPDYVVLFAPFESILSEALAVDSNLLSKAFEKNVSIATPTTMLALLRTVAYVFNRSKLAQNASQIQELAQELLKRITKVHGKISTLGDRIKSTEKAFNDLIASAEENMLRPARKITAIGGLKVEKLKALEGIDSEVRQIKNLEIDYDPTLDSFTVDGVDGADELLDSEDIDREDS
jgi:DNA recombination protein RmuC